MIIPPYDEISKPVLAKVKELFDDNRVSVPKAVAIEVQSNRRTYYVTVFYDEGDKQPTGGVECNCEAARAEQLCSHAVAAYTWCKRVDS